MTHKRKKPGANVIVHSTAEQTQPQQKEESFGTQIANRLQSGVDSVQKHLANHYVLWAGIGAACGAAIYLLATEQGRGVSNQIRNTIGPSLTTAKDGLTGGVNKLKNAMIEAGEQIRETPKLRRV